jgi:hypothetical protein
MKKKILIGSIGIVIAILLIPIVPAINYSTALGTKYDFLHGRLLHAGIENTNKNHDALGLSEYVDIFNDKPQPLCFRLIISLILEFWLAFIGGILGLLFTTMFNLIFPLFVFRLIFPWFWFMVPWFIIFIW